MFRCFTSASDSASNMQSLGSACTWSPRLSADVCCACSTSLNYETWQIFLHSARIYITTSWQSCGGRRGVSDRPLAGVRPAMLRDLLLELGERCSLLTHYDNSRQLLLIRDARARLSEFMGTFTHCTAALPFIDGIPIRTPLDMATERATATSGICESLLNTER